MSKFKLGLLVVFIAFMFIGLIVFALSKNSNSIQSANLTVWGTISQATFDSFYASTPLVNNKNLVVSYFQKDEDNFDQEFIEALANGSGPDILLLPENMIFKHEKKLLLIPFKNYSERLFKDSFIESSEVFLKKDGIVSIPFIIDPMVMYWNRDIFRNASLTLPPKYWDEFLKLTNILNKKDNTGNFSQTAVAFGEWKNIYHSKDIFANFLLQLGNPIIDNSDVNKRSLLLDTVGEPVSPAETSINFYTQFSNPTSQNYSWNRSLPLSVNYFLSGNLATYMGFASELSRLRLKNPNLNFDVAFMPQPRQNSQRVVLSRIYGMSIVKFSTNISPAFSVINVLTNDESIKSISNITNLPPIRRSLLIDKPADAYKSVFYDSAIISKSWPDPDRRETDIIFQNLIESVTSGRARISEALSKANDELYNLIIKK